MGSAGIRQVAERCALIAGLILIGSAAAAQEWITPAACHGPAAGAAAVATPELAPVAAADAIENARGKFWMITSPEGRVSHLWGTLHSSERAILDLPAPVTDALRNAAVLLLESDPVAQSRTELEERALQAGVWLAPTDPAYAKSFLDPRLQPWVAARVSAVTHAPEAMARLTDAGLAALLLGDPCEDFGAGVLPVQDMRLYLAAYEAGVPVKGLEAWDAFLTEMSQPERRDTARAIAETYGAYLNPDGFSEARAAGFDAYRRGAVGEMMGWNRLYLARFFGAEKVAKLAELADGYMIAERNQHFLRALRAPLDAGDAFIAVGAFHLPGNRGLIGLLRAAGYRVERLATPGETD